MKFFALYLSLFAIVNPLGNLPIFVGLLGDLDKGKRCRIFRFASMAGFVILTVFTFAGQWIMANVFHISIEEFKIAGGILLLVVGIRNIVFPESNLHIASEDQIMDVGAVPMAFPLLVGPGAIVTSILILKEGGPLTALAVITLVFLSTALILNFSQTLFGLMGRLGSLLISRIMQIFIMAIGVSFMLSGIRSLLMG